MISKEKQREYVRKYRKNNIEKVRKSNREYKRECRKDPKFREKEKKIGKKSYIKNRDKILKEHRDYYQKNKEKRLRYNHLYYQDHREEILEKCKEYAKNHLEEKKEYQKRYRQDHKEKKSKDNKEWHLKNPDYRQNYNHKYYQKNIENILKQKKEYYHQPEILEYTLNKKKEYRARPEIKTRTKERYNREKQKENELRTKLGLPLIKNESDLISIQQEKLYQLFKLFLPHYTITQNKRFDWLKKQHLDIYICDINIAIEYDGQYHFIAIFRGRLIKNIKLRDQKKDRLCQENGVKLFRWHYSIKVNEDSVKEFIEKNINPIILSQEIKLEVK